MTRIILTLALALAWVGSTSAQEHARWQGSWDTKYGDLRLLQHRNIVVGDYDRFGVLVGIADDRTLRGRFTNGDKVGSFTLHLDGAGGMTGDWQWVGKRTGGDWAGRKVDDEAPTLENIWIRTLNGLSNGMLTGSWETTYGEVRLVQVGDLFVGDYADNGVIIGGRAEDGTITGQFANGSRVAQFSWEAKAGRVDGKYEITFDGSWNFIDEEGASSWSGEKVDHGKPTLMTITGLPVEVMNDPVTEGPVEEAPAPVAGPAPAETVDDEAPADALRVARQNDLPATGEIAEDEARSDHFAGPAPDVLSRWSAGDRVLGLQTAGGFRQYIVLEAPNPEHVGRVLFRGWAAPDGPFVHGYARVFRDGCAPVDYPVSGLDLAETGSFVFLGFKPFLGRDCGQSGYIQQVLTWTRID